MTVDGIEVEIRRSRRARHIRLGVMPDGRVTVTAPFGIPESFVRRCVVQKQSWIKKKIDHVARQPRTQFIQHTPAEYRRVKEQARQVITAAVEQYARDFGFRYRSISVRNQSTRWGSCSKQGNLSFSYRLLFVPNEIRDYVVVHELCHLLEMNHAPTFWRLVEHILPDYRHRKKVLQTFRLK